MIVAIAIAGLNGRMGQMIQQSVAENPETSLALGVILTGEEAQANSSSPTLTTDLSAHTDKFDVLIDFTSPEATLNHLAICAQANKRIVIGTTGFSEAQKREYSSLRSKNACSACA